MCEGERGRGKNEAVNRMPETRAPNPISGTSWTPAREGSRRNRARGMCVEMPTGKNDGSSSTIVNEQILESLIDNSEIKKHQESFLLRGIKTMLFY